MENFTFQSNFGDVPSVKNGTKVIDGDGLHLRTRDFNVKEETS